MTVYSLTAAAAAAVAVGSVVSAAEPREKKASIEAMIFFILIVSFRSVLGRLTLARL